MPIKTDVYLQIGLSKEVFQEFKKIKKLEDWQQKYTLINYINHHSNEVQLLINTLEKLLPLHDKNKSGYKESLLEDIEILDEYIYEGFRLDYIEVYGH